MDGYRCESQKSMIKITDNPPADDHAEREPSGRLLNRARSNTYGLLTRLYDREMTPEFADELNRIGFPNMLAAADLDLAGESFGMTDFEVQATEFARLFIGPKPYAPPFASVYRQDDKHAGQLWGTTTGEVKRFMTHYGLELNRAEAIPDHISILFEFMEQLIQAKVRAMGQITDVTDREKVRREAEEIEQEFFCGYIEPWVERFLQRVERAKPSSFYASVVKFTRWFLTREKEEVTREE